MPLAEAIRQAKRIYLCGNGGSAANAIHIANDLIARGVRAQALTADVATLTAIANDFGYEQVFARQLEVLGEPGDLLVVLSGSGRSPNILAALKKAREIGMRSIAITGRFGLIFGPPSAVEFADEAIIDGGDMQAAEEAQVRLGHELYRELYREFA